MQISPETWTVRGIVVAGERRGRELGYPTANVSSEDSGLPEDGVYAGWISVDPDPDVEYPAAISVGSNPTFAGTRRTVEAHLLDWGGDLYDRVVEVRVQHRLRGMATFASVDELLTAMADDVLRTRALLGVPGPESSGPLDGSSPRAQTRNR